MIGSAQSHLILLQAPLFTPAETPRPFTSIPAAAVLLVAVAFLVLGAVRGLLPPGWWSRGLLSRLKGLFEHGVRIGWLAFVPALILDGLIFFTGGAYSHAWTISVLTFAWAPFAAGLQWEKAWWNPKKGREEAYPTAFNYYGGVFLAALLPALLCDWILSRFAAAGLLPAAALPFNLLALAAVAGSAGFGLALLTKIAVKCLIFPHRLVLFFVSPASRFYALILLFALSGMAAFHYFTIPFFIEVLGYTRGPVPAIGIDQALIILVPNVLNVICVTYFSIFAWVFMSMLPIILFSRALRKKPVVPPALNELLRDPQLSREYLGRELTREDILPTVVTITAYNEPADPLEKTLFGYVKIVKEWISRGLPDDRYLILFSHQTEREEDRLEFESFLREKFPGADPLRLIERDWSSFDEDNPTASIRDESRLFDVLAGWLKHKKLDPDSKPGQNEYQKRRVCQRLYEFSYHAPRELFHLPDPPVRSYGPQTIQSWIWYFLIPKKVEGRLLQVTSKAHNLYYAREGIWGKAETSPLRRDGIYHQYQEWLFDASDADSEIHQTCVSGIIASYSPFYREPGLGWLQRLSYTIDPSATFLAAVKSSSEKAYWSWYLRARVHTYTRGGRPLMQQMGDSLRPVRRDFQAANGHNMVVRGTSIRAAGGDIEHEVATVHRIESPLRRWLERLRGGQPDPGEKQVIERWVPTGEDLELATRMSLEGYYGDYAVYAPQGEGSPADFRGNVPQAIRWSGNNVQLIFMHLARVFGSKRLSFNEKMGYFVNLATLASAPLLYLSVLRAAIMPFLEIPDVYSGVHPALGPFAFILALAPNFLLLALALAGQLVVKKAEPWQRSVLRPWHVRTLEWMGYFVVPPLTIITAAFIPGWLKAVGLNVPQEVSWILLGDAVLFNLVLFLWKREVFASLAYCIVLLPFLQVLYLAWIIFGIIGCVNMLIKTQVVEPYLSRLAGTFHPPVAGRYPSDGTGRFLPMSQRFPWLLHPLRRLRDDYLAVALVVGTLAGIFFFRNPPAGWTRQAAGAAGFAALFCFVWLKLRSLLNDWFLDGDSLLNRWWDYWTNPQAAFVKTIKERQERSLPTLLKDNVYGILNGLFLLALIIHVHLVNAGDFSAALLAYLSFSIGASWIISPFFYEEPHRTLRSQRTAVAISLVLVIAFFWIPTGLPGALKRFFGLQVIKPEHQAWLYGACGALALAGLINMAPWPAFRSFFKRFVLASVMLGLLFFNGLAISYRGVSVEPLEESRVLEADRAVSSEERKRVIDRLRRDDLGRELERAKEDAGLALIKERIAIEWRDRLREKRLPEATGGVEYASRRRDLAAENLEAEAERVRLEEALDGVRTVNRSPAAASLLVDSLAGWASAERIRKRDRYQVALDAMNGYRSRLQALGKAGDALERKRVADLAQEFEAEWLLPLREDLEKLDDFIAELSQGAEKAIDSRNRITVSAGDLAAARKMKEKADQAMERARANLEDAKNELAEAEVALEDAQSRRQAAWKRVESLGEEQRGQEKPSLLADLRVQARAKARMAFLSRPKRYDLIQKDLARYRSVLESEDSRRAILDALGFIASQHWTKRVALDGPPWYPKDTAIRLLKRDLPSALEEFNASKGRADLSWGRLRKTIAASCLETALKAAEAAGNDIEELRKLAESPARAEVPLPALAPASECLARLTTIASGLDPALGKFADAQLAIASLEAFINLSRESLESGPGADIRSGPLLGEWVVERLGKKQGDLLLESYRQVEKDRFDERGKRLAELKSALKDKRSASIIGMFSTVALPPASEAGTLPAEPSVSLALNLAIEHHELALERKDRLFEVEDRILGEFDRLEPYLIGQVGSEEVPAAPYPLLLVRKEYEKKSASLKEAREALFRICERDRLEKDGQIARSLEPRAGRLRAELSDDIRTAAKSEIGKPPWFSLERVLGFFRKRQLEGAATALARLYEEAGGRAGAESGGLLSRFEEVSVGAAEADAALLKKPGDPTLQSVAVAKKNAVDVLAARVGVTWRLLRERLEAAEALEEEIWQRKYEASLAGTLDTLDLEAEAKGCLAEVEEALTPREMEKERLRALSGEIARLGEVGVSEADLQRLFLEPSPACAGEPAAEDGAAAFATVSSPPVPPEGAVVSSPPVPPEGAVVPSPPEGAVSAAPALDLPTAIGETLADAGEPGGALFAAQKEIEAALEESRLSGSRLYPEVFGSLGATSNVPSVFQGGGFGLVTLSLDQLSNREIFKRQEEEKAYLKELAGFLALLKAVRAYGEVVAAEMEEALVRSQAEAVQTKLESVEGWPGAERGSEAWLALERERLRGMLVQARADLASRKRDLNSLLGRPLTREFTTGVAPAGPEGSRKDAVDRFLLTAGKTIEEHFPKHPAFQLTRAQLERLRAQEEEARLKQTWPVLRAGAGVAAPNDFPFTVGGSVIVPLLDRTSRLSGEMAVAEKKLALSEEEERLHRERTRRAVARLEAGRAGREIGEEQGLLRSHHRSVEEALDEYRFGFTRSTSRVAAEVDSLAASITGLGGSFRTYLRSSLDLAETGASVGPGAESGPEGRPEGGEGSEIHRQAERLALAEKKVEREQKSIERMGVGAGVSYSSLFIPLPAVELTYGKSLRRQEAARAGRDFEQGRLTLAGIDARKTAFEARLDRIRDGELVVIQARKRALREEYLQLATRLEREGREPALTVENARKRLQEADDELARARAKAEASETLYRSRSAGVEGEEDFPLSREEIERRVSAGGGALAGYRAATLRSVRAAELEYRYRLLVAAIENKKPYGGNVGNFLSPLWDLVRLWRRPGTAEEISAALAALREKAIAMESAPPGGKAAEEFRQSLKKAKATLGGDSYDVEEVERLAREWRRAEVNLEISDREVARRREEARREDRASRQKLASIEGHLRDLESDRTRAEVSDLLGKNDPLLPLRLEDDRQDLLLARKDALWRYARARAAMVYYELPEEPGEPAAPVNRRRIDLAGLARAYVERDPEVSGSSIALASRRRELEVSKRLSPVQASLPVVLPSLGADPRFGGSGLTTSMGVTTSVERYSQAAILEHEIRAQENDRTAQEFRAGLRAVRDAMEYRLALDRLRALDGEAEACRGRLALATVAREAGEASPLELLEAQRALEEAERGVQSARRQAEEAEETIDSGAGEPVTLVYDSTLDPGARGGETIELTGEVQELWAEMARRDDPGARAAGERSEELKESSRWKRRQSWLSSRLELIASLGQSPRDAEGGGGGFLALPIYRLWGWGGDRARVDEIRSEAFAGDQSRLERRAGEEVQALALRLREAGPLLEQRSRELEIARAAYERESLAMAARRRPVEAVRSASRQFQSSLEKYWSAQAGQSALEEELGRQFSKLGLRKPAGVTRPPRKAGPGLAEPGEAGDPFDLLAEEVVEELTAVPPGPAYDLEEARARLELVEAELSGVEKLSGREAIRELGRSRTLELAAGVLEGKAAGPQLLEDTRLLLEREEKSEESLRRLFQARTVADLVKELEGPPTPPSGGADGAADRAADRDPAPSWEAWESRILQIEGMEGELRAARRESLLKKKAALETAVPSPPRPPEGETLRPRPVSDGEDPGARDARPVLDDLDLAGHLDRAHLPPERHREISGLLVEVRRSIPELRRARILDGIARSDAAHPRRAREEVRKLEVHARYREAVKRLASVLRELRSGPAELYPKLVKAIHRETAGVGASARSGSDAQGSARGEAPEPQWAAVLDAFEESRLSTGAAIRLARLVDLRDELARLLCAEAAASRRLRSEKDAIARGRTIARAEEIAVRSRAIRRKLAKESLDFFAEPEVQAVLPLAGEKAAAVRISERSASRDALKNELEKVGEPELARPPLRLEKSLRALSKAAAAAGRLQDVAVEIEETRESAKVLFKRGALWRLAREDCLESDSTRGLPAALEDRARSLKEVAERRKEFEDQSRALQESWASLRRRVEATGGPSLLSAWREAAANDLVVAAHNRERMEQKFPRLVLVALQAMTGEDPARRGELGALLRRHFPPRLEGGEKIGKTLEAVESALTLKSFAEDLLKLTAGPDCRVADLAKLAGKSGASPRAAELLGMKPAELEALLARPSEERVELEPALPAFERLWRSAVTEHAVAFGELKGLLESLTRKRPQRFLDWAREAGLKTPRLLDRLTGLEAAQEALSAGKDEARRAEGIFVEAREGLRGALAWEAAERTVDRVRREIYRELRPVEDSELEKGFVDARGRLLNLPELMKRDGQWYERTWEGLAAEGSGDLLRHRVAMPELLAFLDLQSQERLEYLPADRTASKEGSPPAATPALVAYCATYSERDESFTRDQALAAMAYLVLQQAELDAGGLGKAEKLLRPFLRYARMRKASAGKFQGLPAVFLASKGEATDFAGDELSNAMVALAAQLHAAQSGSTEFLELSRDIVEAVLLPLVEGAAGGWRLAAGDGAGEPRADALRLAALSAAAFRNEAEIRRATGESELADRCAAAHERASGWLLEAWNDELGAFALPERPRRTAPGDVPPPGRGPAPDALPSHPPVLDAESNLLCLSVLARDERLSEDRIVQAARALVAHFEKQDDLRQRFDSRSFRGNWFLNGPLHAYNSILAPVSRQAASLWERAGLAPLEKLGAADGWFTINRLLHDTSGGTLGFSTSVRGLAPDSRKEGICFTATAQASWVLTLLARRIEETPVRDANAEEIYGLARGLTDQLAYSTLADERSPSIRGWPLSLTGSEIARDPRLLPFQGRLSTEPTCYWIFSRSAKLRKALGDNPFLPADFSKLRRGGMSAAQPASAAASEERRVREWRARNGRILARLEAAEEGELRRLRAGGAAPAEGNPARLPLTVLRSLSWLSNEIDERTGLIRANRHPDHPHACRTYPAALAIIQFALAGARGGEDDDLRTALGLWRSMVVARGNAEAWLETYDARTGSPYHQPGRLGTSHNAWMVLAGLHLYRASRDPKVLEDARETLDWVLSFQDTNPEQGGFGAVSMGPSQREDLSIEGNCDVLAAAWGYSLACGSPEEGQRYRKSAALIAEWILKKMWMGDRFAVGSTLPAGEPLWGAPWMVEWLDSQTWTLLALDATREVHGRQELKGVNGLRFIAGRAVKVPFRGETLQGFAKVTLGPDAFWPEGVAGYVLAARAAGEPEEPYLPSLEAARNPDGTLFHIIGTQSGDWRFDLRAEAIDGTVWATWADPEVNFNPFQLSSFGSPISPARTRSPAEIQKRIESGERSLLELKKRREVPGKSGVDKASPRN